MSANSGEAAPAALLVLLSGSTVTFQRQAHEDLWAAQVRPSSGSRIQGGGQVISLRYEVTRTGSRHPRSVAPTLLVLHLEAFCCSLLLAGASRAGGAATPIALGTVA